MTPRGGKNNPSEPLTIPTTVFILFEPLFEVSRAGTLSEEKSGY